MNLPSAIVAPRRHTGTAIRISHPSRRVTIVSGTPTRQYSKKPIFTPASRATSTTIRLAIEPRIVRLPARVDAMARISHPRFEELLAASGAKFAYVLDPDRPEGRTWDNAGRIEDVATGSAAGPAAGYLMRHGVRPHGESLLIHQGRFTGRPSTIEVRPEPDGRLWVGGPVAPVASGRFHARLT